VYTSLNANNSEMKIMLHTLTRYCHMQTFVHSFQIVATNACCRSKAFRKVLSVHVLVLTDVNRPKCHKPARLRSFVGIPDYSNTCRCVGGLISGSAK